MNKNTFLTALDSLTGKALNVTAVILLSFSCIWLAGVLLVRYISFFDNISFIEPVKSLLKYICILLFVLFLILIALRLCLSPFVPSQEEKDFEAKVDYIYDQDYEFINSYGYPVNWHDQSAEYLDIADKRYFFYQQFAL